MAMYARGNPANWWKSRSCGGGNRAPRAMFVSPVRRMASGGALVALAVLAGGVWYMTRPARISRMAESLLEGVLGGKVKVATGHLSLSGTLLLSGVEVMTPDESGRSLPVFSAEQIEARFDWVSLLLGSCSTQLTAIRPTLYLVEDRDVGRWNYELMQRKNSATKPGAQTQPVKAARGVTTLPVIVLREAKVQWGEVTGGALVNTASAVVDGQFTPTEGIATTYQFALSQRTETSEDGGSSQRGAGGQGVTVSGTWDVNGNHFSAATGEILLTEGVEDALPRQVRGVWYQYGLRGVVSRRLVTFDKEAGLMVGVDANRLAMGTTVTGETDQKKYVVDVSDLRGQFLFGITKPSVKVTGVSGSLLGFRFLVDGELDGTGPTSGFGLHVRFPGAVLGEEYPPLFMAFSKSQELLQRLAPHGKLDLDLSVNRADGNSQVAVNGKVVAHDARMRFGPLPYPLDHVNGRVNFDQESVTFEDVTAKGDENVVHIEGTTGTSPEHKAIHFRVWSDEAAFDDRLAACLPAKFAAVWNQFNLRARGAFNCVVERGADSSAAPAINVEVRIKDGSGYAKGVPYQFENAHGVLSLTANQTEVRGLTLDCGADGSGRLKIDGVIYHPGGDVAHLMPDLKVSADVPIDGALTGALPEEYSKKVKGIMTGGRAGFEGSFKRVGDDGNKSGAAEVEGELTVKEGILKMADGALQLSGITASAEVGPGRLDVKAANGVTAEGVKVSASGGLDFSGKGDFVVNADGADVVLPVAAPGFLPQRIRELWKAYQVAGKVDIAGSATVATSGAIGVDVKDYDCSVTVKGMSLANPDWPDHVHDIFGTLVAKPGRVEMKGVSARAGVVSVLAEGEYENKTGACDLSGVITSDGMPAGWVKKLPGGVRDFLTEHEASGALQVKFTKLERSGFEKPWAFEGEFVASKLAMKGSMGLGAEELRLVTRGTYDKGALDFTGKLSGKDVGMSGKTLNTLGASVAMVSKEKTLSFTDVNGTVAEGAVHGGIVVHLEGENGGEGRYEANLSLSDAELGALLLPGNASVEERKKMGEGRVSATLAVQQTFGAEGDRTGRGELMVRDAKIYNVPLAMGLMQLVTLRLPVARAFNQASMSYYLRDNKVTFEKILLESPSINLAGAGTLSLADKGLDLNFVTESPHELKLPVVSWLVDSIREELLQLTVTGTVEAPVVTPVPLNAISGPLRALLPKRSTTSAQ